MKNRSIPHIVRSTARQLGPKPVVMDIHTGAEASWVDLKNYAWSTAANLINQGLAAGEGLTIIGGGGFELLAIEIGAMTAAVVPLVIPADLPLDTILAHVLISRCTYFVILDGPESLDRAGSPTTSSDLQTGDRAAEIREALAPLSHCIHEITHESLRCQSPMPASIPEDTLDDPSVEERLNALGPVCPATSFPYETPDGRQQIITLSHGNLIETTSTVAAELMADENDIWASLCGLSTPFMRIASWFCAVVSGGTFSFIPPGHSTIESLCLTRPSFVACDEPALTSLVEGIKSELDLLEGIRGRLTRWGFERTRERIKARRQSNGFRDNLADLSVEHLVREITGGSMRTVLCQNAGTGRVMSASIIDTLAATGVSTWNVFAPVTASCFMAVSHAGQAKEGSIGRPLARTAVTVSEFGELVINGYNTMLSEMCQSPYSCNDIDSGNLLSGWKGHIDEEGFVFVDGTHSRGPDTTYAGEMVVHTDIHQPDHTADSKAHGFFGPDRQKGGR